MSSLLQALREAAWLDAKRARAWCVVLAVTTGFIVLAYLVTLHHGMDFWGKPVGPDFVNFWTASQEIHHGDLVSVYDPDAHGRAEAAMFPGGVLNFNPFFYPPVFALFCLPLAYLAYPLALAAWLLCGFVPMVFSLRRILPERWALLPILAFPAWFVNAGHGQNGFVTAALFGVFMISERFALRGGACLGALVFKPQMALAVPVALIFARRWRALMGCGVVAAVLLVVSWVVFGTVFWQAFFASNRLAQDVLNQNLSDPAKMVSVFAALRVAGAPLWLAYAGQIVVAMGALLMLVMVVRRRPGLVAEGAMLVAAACLITPYLFDYDLTILALPIAFIASVASRTGWLAWEKIGLLLAYILPLVARPLAMQTGIGVAPVVVVGLLLMVARRARAMDMLFGTSKPNIVRL